MEKNLYGILSLILVVVAGAPYIRSVLLRKTKPHFFTWLIWGLLTAIAAAGQLASNAGPGAWATILSAVVCLITAFLALSNGEKNITKGDWLALIGGLSAIPFWLSTRDPVYAIVIVTLIDAIGFYPTFRKSYNNPSEEMIFSFIVSNIKHVFSIFAMAEYSLSTVFNPAVIFVMNAFLVLFILWRRHVLSRRNQISAEIRPKWLA